MCQKPPIDFYSPIKGLKYGNYEQVADNCIGINDWIIRKQKERAVRGVIEDGGIQGGSRHESFVFDEENWGAAEKCGRF